MEIVQLRTVMEIYKAGSLSKASMRLNKPQSFISRYLAAFEKECGGQIFRRNGRGVEPTELGERIIPHIESIIETMELMVGCSAIPEGAVSGEVKVFVTSVISKDFVSNLFAEVKRDYPFIRLQFSEGISFEIDSALENGTADVGILLRNGRGLAPRDEPICEFDTFLVGLAPDAMLKRQEILFRDLEHLPLLLPSEPSLTRSTICNLAASRGFPLSIVAEANSIGCTQALLESRAGYLIAPVGRGSAAGTGYVGEKIRQGHLQAARICDPALDRTLVVASSPAKRERIEIVRRAAITVLRNLTRGAEWEDELVSVAQPRKTALLQQV